MPVSRGQGLESWPGLHLLPESAMGSHSLQELGRQDEKGQHLYILLPVSKEE